MTKRVKRTAGIAGIAILLGGSFLLARYGVFYQRHAFEKLNAAIEVEQKIAASRLNTLTTSFLEIQPSSLSHYFHRWRLMSANGPIDGAALSNDLAVAFDASRQREMFPRSPYFIEPLEGGFVVRLYSEHNKKIGYEYESHTDEFLATCAAIKVPLEQSLRLTDRTISLRDVLDTSRGRFVPDQDLEWTTEAYTSYLPNEPRWKNRFGDECSYNQILERLLSVPLENRSCFGTHVPLAVSAILRADDSSRFLSRVERKHGEDYLRSVSVALEQNHAHSRSFSRPL